MSPDKKSLEGISVLMPTFKHEQFIRRAIKSLELQTFLKWELIIINDGSPDNTGELLKPYLTNKKIRYYENKSNEGLGFCLNKAMQYAKYDLIAYLPSDDIYYKNHLSCLHEALKKNDALLAFSNVKSEYYRAHDFYFPNPIIKTKQLVQVLHKKIDVYWMERRELVTDDLDKMFFGELEKMGEFVTTNEETCEWVDHQEQRSKIINEKFEGGIYKYKLFYNVSIPIRYQSTYGNYIDEIKQFSNYRNLEKKDTSKGLKILIVGELAYNPERICAFEERGHTLYGLWCSKPLCFNTIGPLPFGNVEDIPYANWQERVNEIQPDIIYSLLNMQTIELAHEVLTLNKGIPFVWHFKEGPFFCIKYKLWKKLVDLYTFCDGQIFTNKETQDWFNQTLQNKNIPSFLLDGDLPKSDWFTNHRSKLLSEVDGEIHTVLTGRPIGLETEHIKELEDQKIHFHFYGDVFQSRIKSLLEEIKESGNKYFHIHPVCDQMDWVAELSQYDAGWLHLFNSQNFGELLKADWNDLNYPARIPTLASAGLPMLQKDNIGHIVATQSLTKKLDIGIFFNDMKDLRLIFDDKERMLVLRENAWNARKYFQFDTYVDDLILFFNKVISKVKNSPPNH